MNNNFQLGHATPNTHDIVYYIARPNGIPEPERKVIIDCDLQVVTINGQDWEKLMTRIVALETHVETLMMMVTDKPIVDQILDQSE